MSMVKKQKNFTPSRVKPRPVKGLEFTVESKPAKDGSLLWFVKDNTGAVCSGAHETEEEAKKVIPFVKRNLERGFIPYRWLKNAKRNYGQHLH